MKKNYEVIIYYSNDKVVKKKYISASDFDLSKYFHKIDDGEIYYIKVICLKDNQVVYDTRYN